MNGNPHNYSLINRLMKWPVLCGLAGLLLAQTAAAGLDYYINNDVVANAPIIDATNFINNSSFTTVNLETTDTLNYTNNGTMVGEEGFVFDTLTLGSPGGRSMASSFYNPGVITVPASFAGNGFSFQIMGLPLLVNATNIVNPGTMEEGANGLIQLTGMNLNLSYATLTMDALTTFSPPGSGAFGTDTNGDWAPATALTATSASSSLPYAFTTPFFPPYVYQASYATDQQSTNYNIYRMIFIGNNTNANASAQLSFGQITVGTGAGNVQWTGVYTDPATGLQHTNYLILNNDYVQGASTNITFNNGIPSNFALTESSTPVTGNNPGTAGVPAQIAQYFTGVYTNPYSYAQIQISPTTVSTGPTAQNPSGAITNLPARIQISAGRELNLALANITGQYNNNGQLSGLNYLSLTCTNQFDGAAGATIISPYSDINLGVTNGSLTFSNVLQSVIPNWNGLSLIHI